MPLAGAVASYTILLLLLLVPCTEGQPPKATPSGGMAIEQILSKNGCGAFAGLVAATAGVSQVLREQSDSGLTVFCPGDDAVKAFLPRFRNLAAAGQAALLLHHGLAARSAEVDLWLIHSRGPIEVRTLDGGRWSYGVLSICDVGGTMQLASSPLSFTTPVEARVTNTVFYSDRLTVYLIDAVLVPGAPAVFDYSWNLVAICVLLGLATLATGSCALSHCCANEKACQSCAIGDTRATRTVFEHCWWHVQFMHPMAVVLQGVGL